MEEKPNYGQRALKRTRIKAKQTYTDPGPTLDKITDEIHDNFVKGKNTLKEGLAKYLEMFGNTDGLYTGIITRLQGKGHDIEIE